LRYPTLDYASEPPHLYKEAFKGFNHGLRRFLGQIMAGVERAARHIGCSFAPDGDQVAPIKHPCVASTSPHDKYRCGNLAPGLMIRLVMLQIDSSSRAIILAGTVNSLCCEAADVFGNRTIVKECGLAGSAKMAQHEFASRNRSNHALEHLVRLRHKRPVPGIQRPFTRRVRPYVACGQYVQQRDFTHALRMIQRQTMGRARSPVMTGHKKTVISE